MTDAGSIARARADVEGKTDGLDGLVNNAGVGLAAPIEVAPIDDVRRQFEINVFGQLAVTQAFLPLLRKARGRIVNMGSVGGHISIPFFSVMSATKSAFRSFNDALRLELRPFGVKVCLIEPGSISTPAVDKSLGEVEGHIARWSDEGKALYADTFRELTRRADARERAGSPPEVVAEAVYHALTAVRPKTHYPVGKDARLLVTMPRLLPDRWLDAVRIRLLGLPRD